EEEIKAASKAVFLEQRFREEPFQKASTIEDFCDFLLKHSDTLLLYNQRRDSKRYKSGAGSYVIKDKEPGQCFTFMDTSASFMRTYTPPHLIDSIDLYCTKIGRHLIPSFTICPKEDYQTQNHSYCSLKLNLMYPKDKPYSPHYYLQHFIYVNRIEKSNNDIKTIYEVLQKDTTLSQRLRYAIMVIPYTGL
ncbi:MAG: hypothetical protein IT258_08840, partial [Saprospiraceae bacterium]|nr:hypothetical protein [Saprospiraceae bacterium]